VCRLDCDEEVVQLTVFPEVGDVVVQFLAGGAGGRDGLRSVDAPDDLDGCRARARGAEGILEDYRVLAACRPQASIVWSLCLPNGSMLDLMLVNGVWRAGASPSRAGASSSRAGASPSRAGVSSTMFMSRSTPPWVASAASRFRSRAWSRRMDLLRARFAASRASTLEKSSRTS
jgi:hypothetical protein